MKAKTTAAICAGVMLGGSLVLAPVAFASAEMISVPGLTQPIPAQDGKHIVDFIGDIDPDEATLDGKALFCDTAGLVNDDYTMTCRFRLEEAPQNVIATISFVTKGSPADPGVTPEVRSITVDGQVVGLRAVPDGWEAEVEVLDPANIEVVADYVGGEWTGPSGSAADHVYTFTPDDGTPVYYHIRTVQKPVVRSVVVDGVEVKFAPGAKGHWTTSVEVVDPEAMSVEASVAGGVWEAAGHDGNDYLFRFVADRGASVVYYHVIASKKAEPVEPTEPEANDSATEVNVVAQLAQTGATVGGLVGLASLLGGAGVLALRRSHRDA